MNKMSTNYDKDGDRMELTSIQEIVVSLKKVKGDMSIADIQRIVKAKTGIEIAPTTLRRVFREGSEKNDSFNYDKTLKPLAESLLLTPGDDNAQDKIAGLEAVFRLKNERIEELMRQIDELKAAHEARCREYETRMAFLRDQIELKDQRMDRKDKIIEKLMDKVL
jgi:hypothetical protein